MSRYIDRDFLERRIHETMDMQDLYLPIHFIQLMDEQDAADAVEVKHGHWIKGEKIYPDMLNDSTYTYLCSKCHHSDVHGDNVEVPYCWKCGAKMDEVAK